MIDISAMSDEELFRFGSWLYYMDEGWKDQNWWSEHNAANYGHILTVHVEYLYN